MRLRSTAVGMAFLLNGITFGTWAARIPAVQAQTHIDDAGLGFALFASAIGAILTMSIGGWLGSRFGTHLVTPATMVICGAMIAVLGTSWNFWSLALFLGLYGIAQGTMDVCMNANGLAVERAGAGPIMSRLHATWSIGSFSGALISAQVAALAIPVLPQFAVIGAVQILAGLLAFRIMLPDRHGGRATGFRLPSGRLALLGALALVGLVAEGSATDWSGIYVRHSLSASEGMAALAVATFSGSMALARLFGDRLTLSLGSANLVRGGATLAAVGLGLALAVPAPLTAVVGFGLMGAGLAAVVPTIFRAAGSQPGIPSSVGISAVTTMGYAGGLLGPPAIGTIAKGASLRLSLGLVLVMLAILALSARRALATPERTRQSESAD